MWCVLLTSSNAGLSSNCNLLFKQLRHMKLLHPHVAINSPSISPECRDQDSTTHALPEVALVNGEREAAR